MLTILEMFFRAKRLILFSFVILFALILIVIAIKPHKYQARMSFLIRNERAEPLVGADPRQNSIQLPDVTEVNLNSEVELLSSLEVLRQVVLDCHLASGSSAAAIERATAKLGKDLTVTPVRNSSLINVSYVSADRQRAKDVLTNLAEVYFRKRMNLHTASQAEVFFQNEDRSARNSLTALEEERASFLSSRGYENLPQQIQLSIEYIQSLQSQLDSTQTTLDETGARLHQIAADRSKTAERLPTQQRDTTNPYATQQLTSALVQLQNRRAELLTKFNPGDRFVQEVDQQIRNTQDALARFVDMQPQEHVTDANPAWQALDIESNRLSETNKGQTSRAARIRAQLRAQQDRLNDMERDSVKVDDLDRRVHEATERAALYEGKVVATKIADDLDAEHISNVVLASGPVIPALPEPTPLNLFTGLLLAVAASLTLGFVSELLSGKLYGARAIEQEAGIPVIATVPLKSGLA